MNLKYVNVFHYSSRETYLLCRINCGNGANRATDSSGNFEKVVSVKKLEVVSTSSGDRASGTPSYSW